MLIEGTARIWSVLDGSCLYELKGHGGKFGSASFIRPGDKVWSASLKNCSACEQVYYCSTEHQRTDWKEHKKVCKAYKKTQ